MTETLEKAIGAQGGKYRLLSVNCLDQIKEDVESLKGGRLKGDFSNTIVNTYYDFRRPETDFEIRSLLIVATPSPMVRVVFHHAGKRIALPLPPAYIDMNYKPVETQRELNKALNPKGHHVRLTPGLPFKMLAVRSGLCLYGRNNICYAEGMGSFLKITVLYTDIPTDNDKLYEYKRMASCETCRACLQNCPTGAIEGKQPILLHDRCLTHFNERAGQDFPEWIDPSAFECIYGCLKCQVCCPHNRPFLGDVIEPVEFTEQETACLLGGEPPQGFTPELCEKVRALDMFGYLPVLPRNLSILFDKALSE